MDNNKKSSPKPSDFLRERRPERYSDSIIGEEPQLNRGILEYHLDHITGHSEEKDFEYFARKLLEKEICPNLVPQTGPTGGGDSKVDSETYPVSEEIYSRWYLGEASAKERWAIAISAQADWQTKIKKDVANIASTKRGYSLIYFVTNQIIPDKKRAEVEDKLKSEFGIEVRILGRLWIVEKVINNNYFDIVVDTLTSAKGIKFEKRKKIGPNDTSREAELLELEDQIKDLGRYKGIEYQLAEDCLRSATIASELERPREIFDGLILRALRIAKKEGNSRQILRFLYKKAWLSCFVYDDIEELSNLYDEIEKLALDSDHADDVEFIHTLLNVLISSVRLKQISIETAKIKLRSETLKKKLLELSQQKHRPNNAHCARTLLCLHELVLSNIFQNHSPTPDQALEELSAIFSESKGLGEYPFESFAMIVSEIGNFYDSAAYDKTFEQTVSMAAERKHDGEAGVLLKKRGKQKLKSGKPYDAIILFGKAQEHLLKDEYKGELVECLLMCGAAYKEAGLLWAARSHMLSALSFSLNTFHQTGTMYSGALLAAKELAWIELQLGRIPHIIFSLKLANYIAKQALLNESQEEFYEDFLQHIDQILCIFLLRSNLTQLEQMTMLPHLLAQHNFVCSEVALLFALGRIEVLRKYEVFPTESSDAEIEEFFGVLGSQPIELPATPQLFMGATTELCGNILGCNVIFKINTNQISILIAETFLASIQAFFATSLAEAAPYKQEFYINVITSDQIEGEFGIHLDVDDLSSSIEVKHVPDFDISSKEDMLKFRNTIHHFIALLLPRIAIFKNLESHLKRLAEEESAFGRSVLFSDAITLSSNVFGGLDWLDLSFWTKETEWTPFELSRSQQWIPPASTKQPESKSSKMGKGEPLPEMLDPNNKKHTDRKVLSVINIPLWDRAKWGGVFFASYPENDYPPILGIGFNNSEAAKSIFSEWKSKWGDTDLNDELRIALIRGIDKKHPAHYKVHISANLKGANLDASKEFVITSRINKMTPESSVNLERFLIDYNRIGVFYLAPALLNGTQEPEMFVDLAILKRGLIVRSAWEIDDNDADLVVLSSEEYPVIPTYIKDPPVFRALKRKKGWGKQDENT